MYYVQTFSYNLVPMVYFSRPTVDPGRENGFYNVDRLSFIVEYPRSLSSVRRSQFKGSRLLNLVSRIPKGIVRTSPRLLICMRIPKCGTCKWSNSRLRVEHKIAADYHHGDLVRSAITKLTLIQPVGWRVCYLALSNMVSSVSCSMVEEPLLQRTLYDTRLETSLAFEALGLI
jgi:hypothetical protein